ncbi:hypothetical protein [Salinibacterium sp. ZJ77]|uniref:hypothetical protein n=1 Tax=Salinibacterium sp. ZJ77 TaxID=2708337 RepID=UPI00141DB203|nr:hypothetical protein [Salinibacterium sp. ZJ77]
MTTFRLAQAVAPFALVGAVLLTGCSSSTDTATGAASNDTSTAVETTPAVGTGVTAIEDLRWGSIDSDDPALNAAVGELALALNAASPGGLLEVNINCHWADSMGINLITEDETGAITGEQLQAMIETLRAWESPVEIREIQIKGFNRNFGQGDILAAATEIGVNPEFVDDTMDDRIEVPGDQVSKLLS